MEETLSPDRCAEDRCRATARDAVTFVLQLSEPLPEKSQLSFLHSATDASWLGPD